MITPYNPAQLESPDPDIAAMAEARMFCGDVGAPDPGDVGNYRFHDEEIRRYLGRNYDDPCLAAVDMMRSPANMATIATLLGQTRSIGSTSVSNSGGSTAVDMISRYAADLEERCKAQRALTGISSGGEGARGMVRDPIFEVGMFDSPYAPTDINPTRDPSNPATAF